MNNHKSVSTRSELLRQANERMILRVLRTNGPSSRAEVSRLSGVTAPTVSKAVTSLLRSGILEEYDAPDGVRGRPAKKLRLAEESSRVIGFVIDAPKCRIVSTGLAGTFPSENPIEFQTPDTYDGLLEAAAEKIGALCSADQALTLGMGVSIPGMFDYRDGRSVLSPNIPITNNRPVRSDLSDKLGLECVVLQESHALCLAERHYGLAGKIDDFAMLDISTGVGLGVFHGGRLLKGSIGHAGEIGHLPMVKNGLPCGCGQRGCLETVASDTALARLVSDRVGRKLDIDQIVRLVRAGKLDVAQEVAAVCRELAFALVTTINLFNPRHLFIHSRMFDLDPSLLDRLTKDTEAKALPPSFRHCRIQRARGSKREGAIAGIIEHLSDSRISHVNSHFLKVL